MNSDPSKQRIVVVGGAGYLGSVTTGLLLEQGYPVHVFDSFRFGTGFLNQFQDNPALQVSQGDIRSIDQVTDCIQNASAVVLLASLVGEPACDQNPKETVDINYVATKALAEACRYYQVPRFIFASTDSAYGIQEGIMHEDSPMNPISLYARLKMQAEKEILELRTPTFNPTVLRMATIYGMSPRMRFDLIINILTLHSFTNGKITVFGGEQWRPLVHVADAARAYIMCLQAPVEMVAGEVFNVGSNEQNYQIAQIGNLVTEVLPDIAVETVPQTPDLRDYHVCFDKIANTLGYRVNYSVADGIHEIYTALKTGVFDDPTEQKYHNVIRKQ